MGWENRDYNRGGGYGGDYLANPGAILGFSVPFGTWFGIPVRLHFWLLLSFIFTLAELTRGTPPLAVATDIVLLLAALMLHEFGHLAFARWVDGRHDAFMLWPVGGMTFPAVPHGAWPLFMSRVGGIAVNATLAVASVAGVYALSHVLVSLPFNPLAPLGGAAGRGLVTGRYFSSPCSSPSQSSTGASSWRTSCPTTGSTAAACCNRRCGRSSARTRRSTSRAGWA